MTESTATFIRERVVWIDVERRKSKCSGYKMQRLNDEINVVFQWLVLHGDITSPNSLRHECVKWVSDN